MVVHASSRRRQLLRTNIFRMSNYRYYKYRGINKFTIDSLIKGTLYFAPPRILNDPFDCSIDVKKSLQNAAHESDHERAEKLENLLKDHTFLSKVTNNFNDKLGVCSFSLDINETLMWSHYAEDHKGICILYEFPEKFINEPSNKFIGASGVSYLSNPITNWLKSFDISLLTGSNHNFTLQLFRHLLTSKAPSWYYENEARIIKEGHGTIEIPREYLKQICFGLHTSSSDEELITKIVDAYYNNVTLCKARRTRDDFGIEIQGI